MKKFVGIPLAIVGGLLMCWAGWYILAPKTAHGSQILGFNPIHVGLVGVAGLTLGLLLRNE